MANFRHNWESEIGCPFCHAWLRIRGVTWKTPREFQFELVCTRCGVFVKGKNSTDNDFQLKWAGANYSDLFTRLRSKIKDPSGKKGKRRRRYSTARRRSKR